MKLFYVEKEEFLKTGKKVLIKPFENKNTVSLEKRQDTAIGRYILDTALKSHYDIKDYEIITINNKPRLKTKEGEKEIHFNISHTNSIVIVAIDEEPVGIDVEIKKVRELKKLKKRYNKDFTSLDDFYTFWTRYEAIYKLQNSPKKVISFNLKNYTKVSIASTKQDFNFKMYNLTN